MLSSFPLIWDCTNMLFLNNKLCAVQVETSQQNSSQVVQDVTARLQKQHEERLREEQRKHREEIENLQVHYFDTFVGFI